MRTSLIIHYILPTDIVLASFLASIVRYTDWLIVNVALSGLETDIVTFTEGMRLCACACLSVCLTVCLLDYTKVMKGF